ncbi:hypothetical protein [Actinorugispora endophytica]|uniref:hypothetical protein n=1 Tax=Actinorugispora endophytica TaxID=1605990 RepID=UPI001414EB05|nr:hypothetical protein [Actinorugispora endophytica]
MSEVVSALDVMALIFGDAAGVIAPWLWGGLGAMVGAGIAAVVIRSRRGQQ